MNQSLFHQIIFFERHYSIMLLLLKYCMYIACVDMPGIRHILCQHSWTSSKKFGCFKWRIFFQMLFIDMLNLLNDDHPKKIWAAKRVSWASKKNNIEKRLLLRTPQNYVWVLEKGGMSAATTNKWYELELNVIRKIRVFPKHFVLECRFLFYGMS